RRVKIPESSARALAKVAADLNKSTCATCGGAHDTDAHDDAAGAVEKDGNSDHPAHKVADLLVQSGSHSTHEEALAHLLHNPRGAAMLRRLSKSQDEPTMDHKTKLTELAKRAGTRLRPSRPILPKLARQTRPQWLPSPMTPTRETKSLRRNS